ncbi:TRAP transporter small permease [Phyllobacterium salinisoli]|uniref:TRAP transporter small permease protein n=1 Tax=Phyllobacterium salinisoli TaxID=1899321 RepID=A0A368K3B1_9HYPH|nr:TRAP transporter small permease [Phyllobacterium salinisoli]RCS22963.1 TRAP transporter small permease [Phyllobacterium salinisoli]
MKFIGKLVDWLAAVPLFGLLAMFNVAVVMRYWVNQPLQWTEEIAGLLMIWIVMLGAISAERGNQHLTIPLLVDLLPKKARAVFNGAISILTSIFLLYVAYAGYKLAVAAKFKVTSILRISYYWIDIAVPVGFVAIALYMGVSAYKDVRAAFSGEAK